MQQFDLITKTFGNCTEDCWPGVSKLPTFMMAKEKSYPTPLNQLMPNAAETAVGLFGKLMRLDPSKRYSAAKALKHEYFTTFEPPCDREQLQKLAVPIDTTSAMQ
jgi:hypothetical protein